MGQPVFNIHILKQTFVLTGCACVVHESKTGIKVDGVRGFSRSA
jgi:hypothetical protein